MIFSWIFWCFAIFILACGTTHFFSIWTLWNPDYGVEAIVKVLTAAASIATAIALWPLLPRALALPSPHELGQANEALVGRIRERDAALKALEVETAERLKAEEMLRQSQKMEAVGQLTGGVAHDFNNLLTVVVANLERIERRTRASDTEVRHAIESAMDGAERAAALTQQLLAFARKQPLRPVAVDVNALVADLSELLKRTLGERIVLDTALDPAVGPIAVDRNQMENALLNLTVNARDAMPEGGRLTIRTRPLAAAERERLTEIGGGPAIVIEVADTGTGMAPDVAERSLRALLHHKAGRPRHRPRPEPGLRFREAVEGPSRPDDAPGRGHLGSDRPSPCDRGRRVPRIGLGLMTTAPSHASALMRPTVLMVEDEMLLGNVVADELEEAGYRVLSAMTGEEALALLEGAEPIDLLFTDIRLPGLIDGWHLAEAARRLRPDLPVIYASGYTVQQPREVPGSVFLTKPYRPSAVLRAMAGLGIGTDGAV